MDAGLQPAAAAERIASSSECHCDTGGFTFTHLNPNRCGVVSSPCFAAVIVFTSLVAAADVGGVGHPVAAAGALPGDGDTDVDAEHAGEDRGGQVGGELE